MNFGELDWKALDRLRQRFLHGAPSAGAYWETASALESYDRTYGERIGWKWDAVMRELDLRGWRPPPGLMLLDWGCGSGVAGRRVLRHYGSGHFSALLLRDQDPLAVRFAGTAAERAFPGIVVLRDLSSLPDPPFLLILSHVLGELSPADRQALRRLALRASAVLWVEPGTHAVSRLLAAEREFLRQRFRPVAPCPQPGPCPMLETAHARHWCHFFATPPPEVFTNADWVAFGRRAGIDLRSVPYSFLALDVAGVPAEPGLGRIIGRPEFRKGHARFLNCGDDGLHTLRVTRRTNRALHDALAQTKSPLLHRWRRDCDEVF